MTAVDVTAEPLNVPPRYLIEVTGATGDDAVVERFTDSTGWQPVRGANPADLTAGAWTGYDYEAPYSEACTYKVNDDAGETTFDADSLRDEGVSQPWLIHPGTPELSRPLTGLGLSEETQSSSQAVHRVLEREDPVVISDGVRQLPAFALTVKTRTTADENDLKALLADAGVLLLQIVFPWTEVADYYWVAIGDLTRARRTRNYGYPYKRWTLPCTVTAPPTGSQQSIRAWSDLLADFATWTEVRLAYATWGDVLTDTRI